MTRVADARERTLTAPGIDGERVPMRDRSREEVDFCIVGAGAGGGTLGAKLAEAGFSVVIIDAGPHWDPTRDFVSDEAASHPLFWTDERISAGEHPIELGSNNSGRGVGGSTVHYSMIAMRAHPDDFRRRTILGEIAGAELRDWPLGYADLEPFYEEVEHDLQVAGPTFYPWGRRRKRYPQREHDLNACAKVLVEGCTKLGIPVAPAPIATLSAPHRGRSPCVYRGFCNYGCTTNAKSSVLVTYVPRAIRAGAEVRPGCMAARIEHDSRGLATGVLYFRADGAELHRQRARNVVVAGYAVETPRLLLGSASAMFPDGMANSSGCVGRCFMVHTGDQVFAKFPERINQYKAPPPGGAITEHFNRTIPGEAFVCGYTIEVVGPHVVDFASRMATSRGLWGASLRREMLDYNYWSGLGIVGEVLPRRDNRVELHHDERDRHGLPIPRVVFGYHGNDQAIVRHAVRQMTSILEAAGGRESWHADRTAHLLGGCRMGHDPHDSVVDADCRSHDVPNLWICDGSVFPTSAAVNPSLTIQAIASRTAARIRELAARRELSPHHGHAAPAARIHPAPRGTA
ncbi:MAG: GMC family oxidoreductase [Gemmatimonadaceae bacterium]|nr:GMC family oxidoreductase [Gemmatimonadaceae bacterium]NUR21104.1 GMC family oxidoreductase [Gemmatimonadaceae bacterium]NUS98255.1 GMC family oxidoreductase [Gemmatimonadaceae bacterium]